MIRDRTLLVAAGLLVAVSSFDLSFRNLDNKSDPIGMTATPPTGFFNNNKKKDNKKKLFKNTKASRIQRKKLHSYRHHHHQCTKIEIAFKSR